MNIVELQTNPTTRAPEDAPPHDRSVDRQGVGPTAPPVSRWARLRRHLLEGVWGPLCIRAIVVLGGMLGLASIGAASTLGSAEPAGNAVSRGAVWWGGSPTPRAPSLDPRPPRPSARAVASTPTRAVGIDTRVRARASETETKPAVDAPPAPPPGLTPDGRVILNTASATELIRLPGVGPKRAEAILRLRERLKGFRRTSDLLRVRGIGVRTLKKMLPHLVLNPPTPDAPGPADSGAAPPA